MGLVTIMGSNGLWACLIMLACAAQGRAENNRSGTDAGTAPRPGERLPGEYGPDAFGAPTRNVAEGVELAVITDAAARLSADLRKEEPAKKVDRACFEALSSYRCLVSKNQHGYFVTFLPIKPCSNLGSYGTDRLWTYDPDGQFIKRLK